MTLKVQFELSPPELFTKEASLLERICNRLLGVVNLTGKAVPPNFRGSLDCQSNPLQCANFGCRYLGRFDDECTESFKQQILQTITNCRENDIDICLDNWKDENDPDYEELDYSDANVCKVNLGYCMTYMCNYIIMKGYTSDCTAYKTNLQKIINNCQEQSTIACVDQIFGRIGKFKRQVVVAPPTTTTTKKATSTSSTSTKSGSTSTTTNWKLKNENRSRYTDLNPRKLDNVYKCKRRPLTCMKSACHYVVHHQLAKKCGAIVKPKLRRLMKMCKQATVEQCISQLPAL
uniref:DUF19 domain-containing protein n=1 Tax=Romanomermis culicivorax TaxID=13658 RepID=A0A915K5P4_ROMCU